ncbi:MAG: sensor histidine kinase [Phycisphaerales bacterium]|nr:MAG: sensor histidine kinase [Phycisphaerales bacterium]
MTLARQMTLNIVGTVLVLAGLGVVTVWGLLGVQGSARVASEEYRELRFVLNVDESLMAAQVAAARSAEPEETRTHVEAAGRQIEALARFQEGQPRDDEAHEQDESDYIAKVEEAVQSALESLSASDGGSVALASLSAAQGQIRHLAGEMDERIAAAQSAAASTIRRLRIALALACAAIVVATAWFSVKQYRGVMDPLRRMRDGVRRIASGRFDQRLSIASPSEFSEVADDFNHMAAELQSLYDTLDQKVREKSRELVRSERLASVGYLAAGVAHEINNPLNIISGYAELTLRRLRRDRPEGVDEDLEKALQIVRDETFRCKQITTKLLSLSAGRENVRERVSLRQVVDDVTSMLAGLKPYRDRKVTVEMPNGTECDVSGNETELKQVVLNLAINALEAVSPDVGEVTFTGRRHDGVVELTVRDNGRGMAPDTLEHVFEPFFTRGRPPASPGCGLGMSISHAIIEAHGGRIHAESDGVNRGSRFFVELPAYTENGGRAS